mmetsp:Transcript_10613/g.25387  ORF Transcript_10613/g.25387 Transcript_10613/m.25387 type:complete len:389 (-) Transcript_10613:35-1201(-)
MNSPSKKHSPLPNIVETDSGESSSSSVNQKKVASDNVRKAAGVMGARESALKEKSSIFSDDGEGALDFQPANHEFSMTNEKNHRASRSLKTSESESSTLFSCEELRSAYIESENQRGFDGSGVTDPSPADPPAYGPELWRQRRLVSPPVLVRQQGDSTCRQQAPNANSSTATYSFDPWPEIDGSHAEHHDYDDDSSSSFLVHDALKKLDPKRQYIMTPTPATPLSESFTYSSMESDEEFYSKTGGCRVRRQDDQASGFDKSNDGSSYSTAFDDHSHDEHVLVGSRQIQQLLLYSSGEDQAESAIKSSKIVYPRHYQQSAPPGKKEGDRYSTAVQTPIHRGHWFLPGFTPNSTSTCSTQPESSSSWSRLSTPSQSPAPSCSAIDDEKSL